MGRHSETLPSPRREIARRVTVISAAATHRMSYARDALSRWPDDLDYRTVAVVLHDGAVRAACRLVPVAEQLTVARRLLASAEPELAIASRTLDSQWSADWSNDATKSDRHDLLTHAKLLGDLYALLRVSQQIWTATSREAAMVETGIPMSVPFRHFGMFEGQFPHGLVPPPHSVREIIELWIDELNKKSWPSMTLNEVSRWRSAARLLVKAAGLDLDKSVLQFDTLPPLLCLRFEVLSHAAGAQWARADDKIKAAKFETVVARSASRPDWYKRLSERGAQDRIRRANAFYSWVNSEWVCLPPIGWLAPDDPITKNF
jgi:hypothetical protein